MIRIGRAWFESPVEVPVTGNIIFCMNQNGPDACKLSRLGCSQQCIFEQSPAKTCALIPAINCKSRKNHHRYRMSGKTFAESTGCRFRFNASDSKSVKACNAFCSLLTTNIGLGTVGLLIDQGKTLQKLIQGMISTIEYRNVVGGREFLNLTETGCVQSSTPGSVSNAFIRLPGADTGRSRSC